MDGTLLDSEKIWDVSLADLAAFRGGALSPDARAAMVGSSLMRSVALLHEDVGTPDADPRESADFLAARTAELFRTDLTWRPGAPELLAALREADVPTALVTSTFRSLTEIALDTLGRDNFTASVCGDEVEHPKPAPDPYLRAARLLGVAADECVAVEDSPLGVASAEAAGCVVLAVPAEVPIGASGRRTVRDTLVGVDLEMLGSLVAAR
ncbi:HAD family hydrolase [Jatrophihabitans fulvus]